MPRISRHPARFRSYRMWANASRPTRKGLPYNSIIGIAHVAPNNEYTLHATKGYCWRRLPRSENKLLAGLIERAI